MNNTELQALRNALFLSVKDASALCDISSRQFQYWEKGTHHISDKAQLAMSELTKKYKEMILILSQDVDDWIEANLEKPCKDNATNCDHQHLPGITVNTQNRLVLPFFQSKLAFTQQTSSDCFYEWKAWQSATSYLFINGKIASLDDNTKIPKDWQCIDYFSRKTEQNILS